jgi:cleavage stimulation factor subunit 3
VNALPTNLFLHLAYADLLESGKRVPEAKEIYERIIQHTPGTNTLAHIHYLRFLRRTEVRSHSFHSSPFSHFLI